jgi:hypothetical protein
VFLHALPAAQPVLTLAMPPAPPPYAAAGPPASFATAFSPSGAKFAVGGQDGVLVVWDVRSSKPLKVINPSRRAPLSDALREGGRATGTATGWVRDVLGDSVVSSAPPWGVRSIKFGADVLLFTEVGRALPTSEHRADEETAAHITHTRDRRAHVRHARRLPDAARARAAQPLRRERLCESAAAARARPRGLLLQPGRRARVRRERALRRRVGRARGRPLVGARCGRGRGRACVAPG